MKARMEELEREKAEIMTRLHDANHEVATVARETTRVRAKIAEARPDIIVDLKASARTRLDDAGSLSREIDWPIARLMTIGRDTLSKAETVTSRRSKLACHPWLRHARSSPNST